MMSLKQTITDEMKAAMKSQDAERLSVFRMLLAAVQNREIEKRSRAQEVGLPAGSPTSSSLELTEDEAMAVLKSEVKKRKDAIAEFEKAGRHDLAGKESQELAVLQVYLPAEISDEEIEKLLIPVAHGASAADFGRVMREAMKAVGGRASGDRVSAALKRMLTER